MKRPAISILTPTYNRAHVLHRVYDSLKRQKTRDFEWVVVDDGSTDDTPALLERWQEEADFPISWYRYENNRGRNAAVNSGAKLVSGDYTTIFDSDDELLDDALETVAHWRKRSEVDAMPSVSGLYWWSPTRFLIAARKIVRLGLHIGRPPRLQLRGLGHWRARLLWAACIPGGLAGYVRDRLRGRTALKAYPDMSMWGPAAVPESPVFRPPPECFGPVPEEAPAIRLDRA